jgi:hypothetical protein
LLAPWVKQVEADSGRHGAGDRDVGQAGEGEGIDGGKLLDATRALS